MPQRVRTSSQKEKMVAVLYWFEKVLTWAKRIVRMGEPPGGELLGGDLHMRTGACTDREGGKERDPGGDHESTNGDIQLLH
jgi:hypothetical protein